jgi:hypothetical protein
MKIERPRAGFAARSFLITAMAVSGIVLCRVPAFCPAGGVLPQGTIRSFASDGHIVSFAEHAVIVAAADHALKIGLAGGDPVPPVVENAAPGRDGVRDAPPLGRVSYPEIWEGVTAVFEKRPGAVMESTFLVRGGRSGNAIENIRLSYDRPVRINPGGELVIEFANGELRESAPVAWQEKNGVRYRVPVAFRRLGGNDLGFWVGDYDPQADLVIDPTMTWSAFLGGGGYDIGRSIAVDKAGNIFIAGSSDAAWGAPVRAYSLGSDVFVAKMDRMGNLLWSTFLGGSGADYGYGVAVDESSNVYVTGYSDTTWGNPRMAYTDKHDAFVAKLDGQGRLVWNTFLGGWGHDYAYGLALGGSDRVYVTGSSTDPWGSPLVAFSDANDAFAAKLSPSGDLVWTTFIGGSGEDFAYGIAADDGGNSLVTGTSTETWGVPINPHSGGYDAFVAKLNDNGTLVWNTFAGINGWDVGRGIVLDGKGNVFFAGTSSATWGTPVSEYMSSFDAFAAKLDSSGNIVWNTFIGGDGTDLGMGIALDGSGNPYIVGSSDYLWGSPVDAFSSVNEAFVAKLDPNGNLIWHMYHGGAGNDFGYGIATNKDGFVYMTGVSDASWGSPLLPYVSKYDAFVAQIPVNPTFITLSAFKAEARDSYVLSSWTTTAEQGIAGYHLWRKGSGDADYRRLTVGLIPAQGDASTGASYEYADAGVVAGESYLYKMEVVDLAGLNKFEGPVTIVAGLILLNAPADNAVLGTSTSANFSWQGGAFTSFKLEFSRKSDFSTTVLTLPSSGTWLTSSSYTPTSTEWEKVRKAGGFAAFNGSVYWRIRGKTAKGSETVSDVRFLVLLPGR